MYNTLLQELKEGRVDGKGGTDPSLQMYVGYESFSTGLKCDVVYFD